MLLIGLALGAYGLTQAFLQIPFGVASDRFGRKPVIIIGLLVFAAGSFIAAAADDIYLIIFGRVLQGAGAISAAVTALAADLTREQHRTKVMAMIGSSIGVVFAGALIAAPLLYAAIGMSGIFAMTGVLALSAIVLLLKVVPQAPPVIKRPPARLAEVFADPQLLRLNFGVFALHLMQTAMWVLLPSAIVQVGGLPLEQHWKVYGPAIVLSIIVMVPAIIAAEKYGRMKLVFNAAIVLLVLVELGFHFLGNSLFALGFWMFAFFVAFNILESVLPSLISRMAPQHAKGAALGIYNTTQSIGLFMGGALGGALAQHSGPAAVWWVCTGLAVAWLALGLGMNPPAPRIQQTPV
jgi:MFS family permease